MRRVFAALLGVAVVVGGPVWAQPEGGSATAPPAGEDPRPETEAFSRALEAVWEQPGSVLDRAKRLESFYWQGETGQWRAAAKQAARALAELSSPVVVTFESLGDQRLRWERNGRRFEPALPVSLEAVFSSKTRVAHAFVGEMGGRWVLVPVVERVATENGERIEVRVIENPSDAYVRYEGRCEVWQDGHPAVWPLRDVPGNPDVHVRFGGELVRCTVRNTTRSGFVKLIIVEGTAGRFTVSTTLPDQPLVYDAMWRGQTR